MPKDICVRFGSRLRSLRTKERWTQVELAVHAGLGTVYISELERGVKEPCLVTLEILAKSFNMSVSKFLRGV